MGGLGNIKMKPKLISLFLLVGVVPLAAVGFLSSRLSSNALNNALDIIEVTGLALRNIGTPAVKLLTTMLQHQNAFVQGEAADSLGQIKDPMALEPLIEALKNEDCLVRSNAVKALGHIRDPRAVEPLTEMLKDKNCDTTATVAEALGRIKDPKALQPLIEVLKNKNNKPRSREKAAEALGKISDASVSQLLIEMLKGKDCYVRAGASKALGLIKDRRAVQPLITVLKAKKCNITGTVAEALGRIKDPRAVEPLIIALKERYTPVAITKALGNIGSSAVEPLITTLQDNNESCNTRAKAAMALGYTKDRRAVHALIVALSDDCRIFVRAKAAEALGQIKDPKAAEPLIEVLEHEDEDSKPLSSATEALGYLKDPKAVQPLIEILRSPRWIPYSVTEALGKIGMPAMEPLIEVLQDDNERCVARSRAATALGYINGFKAVGPLIAGLKDKKCDISRSVAEALGKIGDTQAINPLVNKLTYWNSNEIVAEALSRLGWKPQSVYDKVHLWVARRWGGVLKMNWPFTKKVLLEDIESDYHAFENALFTFIAIGKEQIIPILIDKLDTVGNKAIAEAYLNCGHAELEEAARAWAAKHDFSVKAGTGSEPVKWGSF